MKLKVFLFELILFVVGVASVFGGTVTVYSDDGKTVLKVYENVWPWAMQGSDGGLLLLNTPDARTKTTFPAKNFVAAISPAWKWIYEEYPDGRRTVGKEGGKITIYANDGETVIKTFEGVWPYLSAGIHRGIALIDTDDMLKLSMPWKNYIATISSTWKFVYEKAK